MSSARTTHAPPAGPSPAGGFALVGFLPYRLSVLAAVVSEGLARTYGNRFGIGIPEWRVLATVGEFRSITATAIGLHAHMGKVKVSRAAASLEARGLLLRVPNPDDRREAFLALTSEGDGVYGEVSPLVLRYARDLTATLSAQESAVLADVIDKLLLRVREMGGEAS